MLLVVVGAGASYDSVDAFAGQDHEARPPLAKELFQHRRAFVEALRPFEACRAIANILLPRSDQESIEETFAGLLEEANRSERRKRQLLETRFYLQTMMWRCEQAWVAEAGGKNNYATLLDDIDHAAPDDEEIALVSFNYDTLLDRALIESGRLEGGHVSYYTRGPRWRLFKLHGSLSWGRQVSIPSSVLADFRTLNPIECAQQISKLSGAELTFLDYFHWVGLGSELVAKTIVEHSREVPLVPALAIPVARKDSFECPKEQVDLLVSLLPKMKGAIVIGWRARDQHLLDLLRVGTPSKTPLLVIDVDRESAKEVARTITQENTRFQWSPAGTDPQSPMAGFSWALRRRVVPEFVRHTFKMQPHS